MSRLENMLYVKAVKEKSVANAPAPGSLEDASLSVGAADGGYTSAGKAKAPGVKGVRIYADVHRKAKNGEGYRITYTSDGVTFKHADSFTEIPVNAGDKLFVDVLPLHHTDGVIELIQRGVEVFYLRRLTLIRKKREELKLPKTTRGDIKVLMSIEHKWFRRVTEDFLVMRRLICTHRTMMKVRQQLINKTKALSERESKFLRPAIESLEVQMAEMATKIAEEAGKRYPAYNRLVEELGIVGNVTAMEALAELLAYIEPDKGFRKTSNLLGLFKPTHIRKKKYSGHMRRALQRLTTATYKISPLQLTAKLEKQTLAKIWRRCRETWWRLDIPAQG